MFGMINDWDNPDTNVPAGVMVCLLFAALIWYCYYYYTRKLREAGPFGRSEITLASGLPARLGQTLIVTLHCPGLPGNTDAFTATLWNIREYWEIREKGNRKEKDARHRTEYLTEHVREITVDGPAVTFNVPIDPAGRVTDYALTEPVYWELEVKDEASGYYARFFLEVV